MRAPFVADAQAASEAEQIREDLRQLKQEYRQRMERLEERLRRLEATGATNVAKPSVAPPASENKPGTQPLATTQRTDAIAEARQFANEQFQAQTEWREGARIPAGPLHERLEDILQDFVEFHGYFRAGYGRDDKGGPQVGFQAPGAFSKYRLGNEAENYGELMLGKNFYVPNLFSLEPQERPDGTPTGPIARVQTMISVYNPYQELLSSGGTSFGLPEAFASIGNVVAAQPSMKFWAGNRYYRRQDIHIMDFFTTI